MRRQALLNLFMLVLVAALALFVLFGPEPNPPADTIAVGPPGVMAIHRVEIETGEGLRLAFAKKAGRWTLQTHPHWPVDSKLLEQILALPESTSHARYAVSEVQLKALGLASPRILLRLDDTEYQFGAQEPLALRRYLRVDDTVHLITDTLIHQLSVRVTDWVDRRLFSEELKLVRLVLPGLTLDVDENGRWQTEPPTTATPDDINALVDRWRYARALAVEPHQANDAGETIQLTRQSSPEPLTFQLIRDPDAWWLQRPDLGLRYRFHASTGRQLLRLSTPATKEETQ